MSKLMVDSNSQQRYICKHMISFLCACQTLASATSPITGILITVILCTMSTFLRRGFLNCEVTEARVL